MTTAVVPPTDMTIERPLILIGAGRSGSTALTEVLSYHPRLAWLSGLADRYPARPAYNRHFLQTLDAPLLRGRPRRFQPHECYRFWEHYCKGFTNPYRDLRAEDVTPKAKRSIRRAFEATLTPKRDRLLLKITGWSRLGYLDEIFPDARFVHLVRDGRAVANSLLSVPWWHGWRGPQSWRLGALPSEYREEWEAAQESFVALAGIYWKILMDAVDTAREMIEPSRFLEVRYEDLCAEPESETRRIADFAGLDWPDILDREVGAGSFRSSNAKWERDLTRQQQEILQSVVASHLSRFEYQVGK